MENRKIFDGEYFKIIAKVNDEMLLAKCMICDPNTLPLRVSIRSLGNLLKHVRRKHSNLTKQIYKEKRIKEIKCGALRKKNRRRQKPMQKCVNDLIKKPKEIVFINALTMEQTKIKEEDDDDDDCLAEKTSSYQRPMLRKEKIAINKDIKQGYYKDFADIPGVESFIGSGRIFKNELDELNYPLDTELPSQIEFTKIKNRLLSEMERLEQKHSIEMETLKCQLEYKRIEHRKKLEFLNNKLREVI